MVAGAAILMMRRISYLGIVGTVCAVGAEKIRCLLRRFFREHHDACAAIAGEGCFCGRGCACCDPDIQSLFCDLVSRFRSGDSNFLELCQDIDSLGHTV